MEQRHRDLLEAKRLEISSDLRFRDIRRHLLDNGILNGRDLDDVESEEKRGDQVKALLDILPDRGPKAFNVFRDALKHRYPHLARILNDDGQEEEAKQNETRVFIIHAGEDKDSFVRPLVSTLRQRGLAEKDIFFDDVSIRPGEVIRDRIISTLSSQNLELAVIVVSTSFLNKHYWPKLEFETCLRNNKRIFPIWVDSNTDNFKAFSESVGKYSPTLKQLSARRVQRDDVTDELPKVAAEVVQRVSTLSCTQPGPTEQAVKEFQRLSIAPASSDLKQVDCSPSIHHTDISAVLYGYHGTLHNVDRRLLQETMTLVTTESRWVMEHAQITVYGKDVKVQFYSGKKTNKYVVHLTGDDCPVQRVEEKGWRLWFRDGVVDIWTSVKETVTKAVGSIAGQIAMVGLGGILSVVFTRLQIK